MRRDARLQTQLSELHGVGAIGYSHAQAEVHQQATTLGAYRAVTCDGPGSAIERDSLSSIVIVERDSPLEGRDT